MDVETCKSSWFPIPAKLKMHFPDSSMKFEKKRGNLQEVFWSEFIKSLCTCLVTSIRCINSQAVLSKEKLQIL